VSDQIGRHDASGPLARDADGRVDPEGYVRSAMQGRELLLMHGFFVAAYAVALLVRGFGMPGALIALAMLVLADVVIVGGVRIFRWWTERQRRRAGGWPSWPAHLFVMQARAQGVAIPKPVRDDARLRGLLSNGGDQWVWTPGRAGQSSLVQPISLRAGLTPPA
jgi:hypothetical protein